MTLSKFEELQRFIRDEMRMSHVYQPVMLIELLRNGGHASTTEIAKALLSHDRSQIEYYEKIVQQMPGRVLTANRGITEREGKEYRLKGFEELTSEQVGELVLLCEQRQHAYVDQRGKRIWQHRTVADGYVPGTIRYEVLKRAHFRCELCGTPASEKAIEVDHIVPRNKGGSDELHNLQALCYSCNATKRDRDDTDFRGIAAAYSQRAEGCVFCEAPASRVAAENELAFAIRDLYPVTEGHTLVIPKRHVPSWFALFQPELNAINQLLQTEQLKLRDKDHRIAAFNVGINDGAEAGQTVGHCHVHLIPRRQGDMDDPRGGVRGVIPDKRAY